MGDSYNDNDFVLYCGNLQGDVTEQHLYELFLQAGPLESVRIAKDRGTGTQKDFAFITFKHVESVPYTINIMKGIRLFGHPLRLQPRPGSIHDQAARNQQQPQNMQQIPTQLMQGGLQRSSSAPQMFTPPGRERRSRFDEPPRSRDSSREYGRDRSRDSSRGDSRDRRDSRDSPRGDSRDRRDSRDSPRGGGDRRGGDMGYYQGGRNNEQSFDQRRQNVLHMQQRQLNQYNLMQQQQQSRGGYNQQQQYYGGHQQQYQQYQRY